LVAGNPTIGPTGAAAQNVNGRAGSLELYFGEDVLRRRTGDLTPVEWRSYDSAVGDWQGELLDKALLQQRFAEKTRRALEDPGLLESLDWTGIRQIIDRVLYAFAEPYESGASEVESSSEDPGQHPDPLS
jgi:hypothetical protein